MSCETFRCVETIGLTVRPDAIIGVDNKVIVKPIRPRNAVINFKKDGSTIIDSSFAPTWSENSRAIFSNGPKIPLSNLSACPGYVVCPNYPSFVGCDHMPPTRFLGTLTWKAAFFPRTNLPGPDGSWPDYRQRIERSLIVGKTTKQLGIGSFIETCAEPNTVQNRLECAVKNVPNIKQCYFDRLNYRCCCSEFIPSSTWNIVGLDYTVGAWYIYATWSPDGCARSRGFKTPTKSKLVKINWIN